MSKIIGFDCADISALHGYAAGHATGVEDRLYPPWEPVWQSATLFLGVTEVNLEEEDQRGRARLSAYSTGKVMDTVVPCCPSMVMRPCSCMSAISRTSLKPRVFV